MDDPAPVWQYGCYFFCFLSVSCNSFPPRRLCCWWVVGVPRVVFGVMEWGTGWCPCLYGLWTWRKHHWKLVAHLIDVLNNLLACRLCTDVAVLYFSDDRDKAFGNGPPSLWFQLISWRFKGCLRVLELMGSGLSDNFWSHAAVRLLENNCDYSFVMFVI